MSTTPTPKHPTTVKYEELQTALRLKQAELERAIEGQEKLFKLCDEVGEKFSEFEAARDAEFERVSENEAKLRLAIVQVLDDRANSIAQGLNALYLTFDQVLKERSKGIEGYSRLLGPGGKELFLVGEKVVERRELEKIICEGKGNEGEEVEGNGSPVKRKRAE